MYFSSEGIEIPKEQTQFRHYDEDGNEYWEVDKILKKKYDNSDKRVKYLVSWKGFGQDHNTWEPIENLETVLDDVQEFEKNLKEQKKGAKQSKSSVKSQPKTPRTSSKKTSIKKLPEVKVEENSMNIEQEPSSPIKSKQDESDEELGVRIKKKTSAKPQNKQNSHEDSTTSSNTPINKPPPIVTEINLEASKENIVTPIRDKISSEILPSSNIDPTFQNLSKLMEVEEKPSPIILNNENLEFHGAEEIPPSFNEEVTIEEAEYAPSRVPVPEVVKQEFGVKVASDKTKKNLENMFDDLDKAIEVEDIHDSDDQDIVTAPPNTQIPYPNSGITKKINVAEAIKSRNIVIESDGEEEKLSRKYSDNSKKDISPREVGLGRKDSGSRSPFDRKDSRDYKKNHYDKYGKLDDYKGKDRHYDHKKKRDRSRSHDRDKEKDHYKDHRDKEKERERERDKDRYKSKDKYEHKPSTSHSHSHSHSQHHDVQKNSKSSFSTTKDSYNDKRDKSISPTYKDNYGGKKLLATKQGRVSAFGHPEKPSNTRLEIRKNTGAKMPRKQLATKAAKKMAYFDYSKGDSSEDDDDEEEDEEGGYNALEENHKISTGKDDKSKSPRVQENFKEKSKSPITKENKGIEVRGIEEIPKKREVVKRTLYAKNELKKDIEEEMGRYYGGLVGDYLQGKVNKEKFVEMLSVEGNFKEDQVEDIVFMSWEGKATMNPQDYYFKVVWKTRENGVQMPSRLVTWSELVKESPENIAEFVMKKLLNIVTKYGTFGEC